MENNSAKSLIVYWPVPCMRRSSFWCLSDSLGCLPRSLPFARAIFTPSRVRRRIRSASNSAKARDLAEIRVFHKEHFLCRAICPELAGATIPLRDILRARNRRRRELRTILRDRKKPVEELLELKKGATRTGTAENSETGKEEKPTRKLKRYFNE
jgi:hypothetical protein